MRGMFGFVERRKSPDRKSRPSLRSTGDARIEDICFLSIALAEAEAGRIYDRVKFPTAVPEGVVEPAVFAARLKRLRKNSW
jgi:hypothetical protein